MTNVAYHIPFDTLKFVETLKTSGMPDGQAKALLEAQKKLFEEALDNNISNLATKNELKQESSILRSELKAEIAELRNELKSEIAELRNELKSEIAELRSEVKTEIAKLKIEMVYMRWMLGILIFGVGSLVIKAFL